MVPFYSKRTHDYYDSLDRADDRGETADVQAGQLWPALAQPAQPERASQSGTWLLQQMLHGLP